MTCMKYGILECVDNFGRYRQRKSVWVIVKTLFFYNSIPGRLSQLPVNFQRLLRNSEKWNCMNDSNNLHKP